MPSPENRSNLQRRDLSPLGTSFNEMELMQFDFPECRSRPESSTRPVSASIAASHRS